MYIHLFNFYVGCRLIYSTLFIENDSKKQQKQQQQLQQTDRQTDSYDNHDWASAVSNGGRQSKV